MTQLDKVLQVATLFRTRLNETISGNLAGECGNASSTLKRILAQFGIQSSLYAGQYFYKKNLNAGGGHGHCWLRFGNTIIDVTATQFDQTDKVFVQKHNSKHYKGNEVSYEYAKDYITYVNASKDVINKVKELQLFNPIKDRVFLVIDGCSKRMFFGGDKPQSGTYKAVGPKGGTVRGKDAITYTINNKSDSKLPFLQNPKCGFVRI